MSQQPAVEPFPVLTGGPLRRRRRIDRLAASAFRSFRSLETSTVSEVADRFDVLRTRCRSLGDLDDGALVEGLALAARAAVSTLGLSAYPVQILGACVVADGAVAEMQTGEGKTLSTALAAAVLSLPGNGVHVATANEYLAIRDAAFLEPLAAALGFRVGVSRVGHDAAARKLAHSADVVYGTATSLGFDYLYDNLAISLDEIACRPPYAALVDEADSVLLDEARTPLLVSGPAGSTGLDFRRFARAVASLEAGVDVHVDLAKGAVAPLPPGVAALEAFLGVDDLYARPQVVQQVQTALTARFLLRDGVDYLVTGTGDAAEVVLIDANTGRRRDRSRLSSGLHEALEAKEGVPFAGSGATRAATSIQNFFSRYRRLGGMTGTASSSSDEFEEYYRLEVFCVPTNLPRRRVDLPDRIFATGAARDAALADEVAALCSAGRPVLVLTESLVECERLGAFLSACLPDAPLRVLSARSPDAEAEVIAQAGAPGSLTVATAMAGRGVDILLGGSEATAEVREMVRHRGGLAVLSSCRFPSRRVDDQLRGRSGRQGDPGSSQFFLSFDDEIARLYAPASLVSMLVASAASAELPSTASSVFARAQSSLESEHRLSRRAVLRADQPLVEQRELFYRFRRSLLGLSPWRRAAAVVFESFRSRLGEEVASPSALSAALRPIWPGVLTLPEVSLPATGDAVATEMTSWFLDRLQERLAPLAGLEPVERADLLTRLVGSLVLDSLDRAWARHLESSLALYTDASLTGRVGQRPNVVYRSMVEKSFAGVFADFQRVAVANLGGLRVDSVSRREPAPAV